MTLLPAPGVRVRVGVNVGPTGVLVCVAVRVGVCVGPTGVLVRVGVRVGVSVGPVVVLVLVAVGVGVSVGAVGVLVRVAVNVGSGVPIPHGTKNFTAERPKFATRNQLQISFPAWDGPKMVLRLNSIS